ncbi:MAG: hypothetical protein ACXVZL_11865 [Gaiellaceae bacterium]
MRRVVLLAVVVAAALAAGVARAAATNECRGLQVCIPIQGPWVLVPTGRSVPRPEVQFQLSCPKGYIVGGTDAELTDAAIDVSFLGSLGAPVNPGVTTARDLVFVASFVGAGSPTPSFRPHLGCMPAQGGGGRVPTSARAVVPPGKPTVRRVVNARLVALRTRRVVKGCAPGEHLVGAATAVGFDQAFPPSPLLASSVQVSQAVRAGRVVVSAHAGGAVAGTKAIVQVEAICVGGR